MAVTKGISPSKVIILWIYKRGKALPKNKGKETPDSWGLPRVMCKTLERVCCYYAEFGVEDLEKEEERKKPLKSQTTAAAANRSSG